MLPSFFVSLSELLVLWHNKKYISGLCPPPLQPGSWFLFLAELLQPLWFPDWYEHLLLQHLVFVPGSWHRSFYDPWNFWSDKSIFLYSDKKTGGGVPKQIQAKGWSSARPQHGQWDTMFNPMPPLPTSIQTSGERRGARDWANQWPRKDVAITSV